MARWSGIRKKLEGEYLAPALRGHIQYFATTYKASHDREGRAAICLDGKEILSGAYYNPKLADYDAMYRLPMDETAMELGAFDQRCFYEAFDEFDNQRIETSLASENPLVRVFALLDRRVGKRRLTAMREAMKTEAATIQMFYAIRMAAEMRTSIVIASSQNEACFSASLHSISGF